MNSAVQTQLDWIAYWQASADLSEGMQLVSRIYDLLPLLILAVYLGHSQKAGLTGFLLLFINEMVIACAKATLQMPRPAWVDPRIIPFESSGSFGFPSGHVQASLVIFSYFAILVRHWAAWACSICLILLMSASRVYLGVHFIHDVIGGILLGICVLFAFLKLSGPISLFFKHSGFRDRVLAVSGALLILYICSMAIAQSAGAQQYSWTPQSNHTATLRIITSKLFIAAVVVIAADRFLKFKVATFWKQRVSAFGAAILGLFLLKLALNSLQRVAFPDSEMFVILSFASYCVWMFLGAPVLLAEHGGVRRVSLSHDSDG